MTRVEYRVEQRGGGVIDKILADQCANGWICGDDMLILWVIESLVYVLGLSGHEVSQLHIVHAHMYWFVLKRAMHLQYCIRRHIYGLRQEHLDCIRIFVEDPVKNLAVTILTF